MIIKWRCNCGWKGESDLGYWMRCDNPLCNQKNAFEVIDIKLQEYKDKMPSIIERIERLELKCSIDKSRVKEKT